jgi:hypothetical protein
MIGAKASAIARLAIDSGTRPPAGPTSRRSPRQRSGGATRPTIDLPPTQRSLARSTASAAHGQRHRRIPGPRLKPIARQYARWRDRVAPPYNPQPQCASHLIAGVVVPPWDAVKWWFPPGSSAFTGAVTASERSRPGSTLLELCAALTSACARGPVTVAERPPDQRGWRLDQRRIGIRLAGGVPRVARLLPTTGA